MSGRPAAFLDRDGVLNALVRDPVSGLPESPLHPEQVRLLPGAAAAASRLAAAGFFLVGASNQPAAAKGKVSLEELRAVQARVLELLAAEGVRFDDFRLCWHHPEAVVAELRGPCDCRKPAPGMLLAAAAELGIDLASSWMIGDSDADLEAGRAAGCRIALVEHPDSGHRRAADASADIAGPDLAAVAAAIVDAAPAR